MCVHCAFRRRRWWGAGAVPHQGFQGHQLGEPIGGAHDQRSVHGVRGGEVAHARALPSRGEYIHTHTGTHTHTHTHAHACTHARMQPVERFLDEVPRLERRLSCSAPDAVPCTRPDSGRLRSLRPPYLTLPYLTLPTLPYHTAQNPGFDFSGASFNGQVPSAKEFMGGVGYNTAQ